jgi:hypothetical protein
MKYILYSALAFLLISCQKVKDLVAGPDINYTSYNHYEIQRGEHGSEQSGYTKSDFTELNFLVKFDSTAIYSTTDPANQLDVNKLYGFSDNNSSHHAFSARIGWRWSDGALRLFGYVYNDSKMSFEELAVVPIGVEISCSIKVSSKQYVFSANGNTISMPRTSNGDTAKGYRLFPYFGGDETAPHNINIWIKEK